MTPFDIFNKCVADLSRPLSIFILSAGLTTAIFYKDANIGVATIAGALASALVGARSYENHATIKADASVKIAEKVNGPSTNPG